MIAVLKVGSEGEGELYRWSCMEVYMYFEMPEENVAFNNDVQGQHKTRCIVCRPSRQSSAQPERPRRRETLSAYIATKGCLKTLAKNITSASMESTTSCVTVSG